jgi:sodium/hydrogen exchanger 10/11
MISATDPVAVVAVMKEQGVSRKLAMVVEGESLLNDGTAMVGFLVVLVSDSWSNNL